MQQSKTVLGYRVFNCDLENLQVRKDMCATILTISPNSYGMARRDPAFKEALQNADYLLLDGVYFALASILRGHGGIRPNNGPSLFRHLCERMNKKGGRVFFLGSKDETLAKITARMRTEFPHVTVGTFSPPFKPEFTPADDAEMVARVNDFAPEILFVGMTAPKQEKWAHRNRGALNCAGVAAVGAVFDWFAGNERPIAPIWWRLHLGWLIRTIHRPEILLRYPNIAAFFWDMGLDLTGIRRIK